MRIFCRRLAGAKENHLIALDLKRRVLRTTYMFLAASQLSFLEMLQI
jgi:hypothetical protein